MDKIKKKYRFSLMQNNINGSAGGTVFIVFILAARVKLAEDEFPVPAIFLFVKAKRDAAAVVVHLNRKVAEGGNGDHVSVPLTCLVDRI